MSCTVNTVINARFNKRPPPCAVKIRLHTNIPFKGPPPPLYSKQLIWYVMLDKHRINLGRWSTQVFTPYSLIHTGRECRVLIPDSTISCVNPWFYTTSVVWNLGLTQKIPGSSYLRCRPLRWKIRNADVIFEEHFQEHAYRTKTYHETCQNDCHFTHYYELISYE